MNGLRAKRHEISKRSVEDAEGRLADSIVLNVHCQAIGKGCTLIKDTLGLERIHYG